MPTFIIRLAGIIVGVIFIIIRVGGIMFSYFHFFSWFIVIIGVAGIIYLTSIIIGVGGIIFISFHSWWVIVPFIPYVFIFYMRCLLVSMEGKLVLIPQQTPTSPIMTAITGSAIFMVKLFCFVPYCLSLSSNFTN